MADESPQVFHFANCPHCGSTDRMVTRLAQKAKDQGLARKDWTPCMQEVGGVVVDPIKAQQVLIGQAMPAYKVRTDVCLKCGTIYAVDILLTSARQEVRPQTSPLVSGNGGSLRPGPA